MEPGDEVVILMPQYMQLHGLARGLGARVREVWLREERGWRVDLDELRRAVGDRTKAVCVCQPNNPTGQRLSQGEVEDIARIASERGAWILSRQDLPRRGARRRRDGHVLRDGGARHRHRGPVEGVRAARAARRVDRRAARADRRSLVAQGYTTIAPATLSERLAERALARRAELVKRARYLMSERWPLLEAWAMRHSRTLHWTPPQAGTICFFSYQWPIDSVELSDRLIRDWSTMLVPGAHFSAERHLRIGFGMPSRTLDAGLSALDRLLVELGF